MTLTWFKLWGPIYRPTSIFGFIIPLLILAFCVQVTLFFNSRAHSVTDFLYSIFPYVVPSLLLLERIAAHTSGKTQIADS